MFDNFSDHAKRVVVLAQNEATQLGHASVDTEHILLGLIREGDGLGVKVLKSLSIDPEKVRRKVEETVEWGEDAPNGTMDLTPSAKKVLELASSEATRLGHTSVGTEHILIGLIREEKGVAARVLVRVGASLNSVRREMLLHRSKHSGRASTFCSNCGQRSPSSANFCGSCGKSVAGADSDEPVEYEDEKHEKRKKKSSNVAKGASPLGAVAGVYLLLHFTNALPDNLDIFPRGNLDTNELNQYISAQLSQQLGGSISVTCPAEIPMRQGEISDCTAVDGYSRRIVRVSQDDSKGHITFLLTPQAPGT